MSESEKIQMLIQRLMLSKRNSQIYILKEILPFIQFASARDMQDLLRFINSTNDVELLVKLFCIISSCLTSNYVHNETIILNAGLYDKVQDILNRGLPLKSAVILNFISTLVHAQEDEDCYNQKNILSQYAKNMIRVSGCLRNMSMFFLNNMMYPETWRALCFCLAECCRGSDTNQAYCAHLIPICVDKCRLGDVQVLPLLQLLLQGNKQNCERFINCNGLNLFTRDYLEQPGCMEVLNSVIQTAPETKDMLRNSAVPDHLRQILKMLGTASQIGQWCTVILFYIHFNGKDEVKEYCHDNKNTTKSDNTTMLYHNIMKEIINSNEKSYFSNSAMKEDMSTMANNLNEMKFMNFKNKNNSRQIPMNLVFPNKKHNDTKESTMHENNRNLSFSFLNTYNSNINKKVNERNKHNNIYLQKTNFKPAKPESLYYAFRDKCCQTMTKSNFEVTLHGGEENKNSSIAIFDPPITSTPKHKSMRNASNHLIGSGIRGNKSNTFIKRTPSVSNQVKNSLHNLISRENFTLNSKLSKRNRTVKNRSMSTRLLGAINNSCASILNTVKDIIMPTKLKTYSQSVINSCKEVMNCSYSFTNYMNKRDAILNNSLVLNDDTRASDLLVTQKKYDLDKITHEQCKTCNDTLILKSKLENNDYLKETVKKLKMGITLYGCDFKKMAKQIWPKEAYMTPNVLYILYKKLILK